MLNLLLIVLVPVLLAVFASKVSRAYQVEGEAPAPLAIVLMLAYLVRVVAYYIQGNVQLFSHGIGGDYLAYQQWSEYIVAIWQREGVHMVTADQLPMVGKTSLPPNLFAMVNYLNGGPANEGCAALSAGFAGVTALNLFSLSMDLGAATKRALTVTLVFLFLPGFILYSADMYKDPLVWMLVFGVLASSVRLMNQLRTRDVIIGLVCAVGLWYVRFYLVFLTVAPLAVGLFGLNTKNPVRTLLLLVGALAVLIPLLAYTKILGDFSEQASETFERSTGSVLRVSVAKGTGSGVVFDDGGQIYGALHLKLLYTLFSPFPWQSGSFALHVGKIDALAWFYFAWRAIKAGRGLLRTRPGLLFALLTFLIPTTLAYAFSMYNVGLILRQRMPVVIVSLLLASLSWPEDHPELVETEDDESEADQDDAFSLEPLEPEVRGELG